MNETSASMNRYVPFYNPLTGAYYRGDDATGYLES